MTTTAPRRAHTLCARERFARALCSDRSFRDGTQFAPHRCKPRLLLARQPGRSIVMSELGETCLFHVAAPRFERMEDAVAISLPAFFVIAARIRAHQHAVDPQRRVKLRQYTRKLLTRNVEQRGVRKHAVEMIRR